MHELSLACELVDVAERAALDAGATAVTVVHLRLGALAGVDVDALRTGFVAAVHDTLLAGAALEIVETPALGWCPQCQTECAPIDLQWLACPACCTPLAHLTGGREIEIATLEVEGE